MPQEIEVIVISYPAGALRQRCNEKGGPRTCQINPGNSYPNELARFGTYVANDNDVSLYLNDINTSAAFYGTVIR